MIFTYQGVRCALVDGVISYKGPRGLFKLSEVLFIEKANYTVVKIAKSEYQEGVTLVTVERNIV